MRVLAIGGGSGLSSLLKGLKKEVNNKIKDLCAVVTVADNGGSTGRLRKDYKIPAPGDIRNCIVALSESEDIMSQLFQFRFNTGDLKGHALGNIFLLALTEITGNFLSAVKIASQVLRIKGEILPATLESVDLCAQFLDGTIVRGEEEITKYGKESKTKISNIWIEPKEAKAPIDVIAKIEEADVIIFGPGSLYTSIIPNLLIQDIKQAIERSSSIKIFIVNAMTQPGETEDFTAYEHISSFIKHTGVKPDVAIVNTRMPSDKVLRKYLEEGQEPVIPDVSRIAKEGIRVYTEDLIGEKEDFVRHDPERLTNLIMNILLENAAVS